MRKGRRWPVVSRLYLLMTALAANADALAVGGTGFTLSDLPSRPRTR